MIFFSEKKLAARLREEGVTRNHLIIYSTIVLVWFSYSYGTAFYNLFTDKDFISLRPPIIALHVLAQILNAMVIYYAFKINQKGDGRDFVIRFISLAVPIGLKALGVMIILAIPYFHYQFSHYFDTHPNWMNEGEKQGFSKVEIFKQIAGDWVWVQMSLLFIILSLFWVWRLNVSFKIASGQTALNDG